MGFLKEFMGIWGILGGFLRFWGILGGISEDFLENVGDFCGFLGGFFGYLVYIVDFCGFGVDLEAILGRIPQFLAHFPHPSKPPR